ncbi:MAG: AI-2E family transporter [Proteobacteria bacterium]|nr:AI-2E family transporter [Pseudomonadota bacterium]
MSSPEKKQTSSVTQAIEIAIRLGLIFLILAWCLQILSPFIGVIAWGAIIAIAIYKPFIKLAEKLGGNQKLTVALVAIISIGAILIPVISMSTSIFDSATIIGQGISEGKVKIAPPAEAVREWPMVGEKAYAFWLDASNDLTNFLEKYPDQLSAMGKKTLGAAAGVGKGVLMFIVSMLIAAAFLSNAEGLGNSMRRFALRLSEEHGEALLTMSVNTVRSVAVGVIGIALIQAILGGLGMMVAGVPAAGLLALVILVLGIAQLPPLLVLLPVIIYVFSVASTPVALVFMIWSILVSFSDMVLKPMLLGRGVDAPMLVILLGAIGGMITAGIVGLFIGAVILAVGYKLFQAWIDLGTAKADAAPETDTSV